MFRRRDRGAQPKCREVRHYLAWARLFHTSVDESLGFLEGRLYHLWHGDLEHRGYKKRHEALAQLPFDPDQDLEREPSGVWKWKRERSDLADLVFGTSSRETRTGRMLSCIMEGFNESCFLPPPAQMPTYQDMVVRGRKRMRSSRVVICGLARDLGLMAYTTVARIGRLARCFAITA